MHKNDGNIEMQQQCTKMDPKATKSVPKWSPKPTKGYQNEAKTIHGSLKGALADKDRTSEQKTTKREALSMENWYQFCT
jgi:hypothetical protein